MKNVNFAQEKRKEDEKMVNDYGDDELYGPNHILDVEDSEYLVQGKVDDELVMFREIDELLECERDEIQKYITE